MLHLGYIDGKCYHIWHTWILWEMLAASWLSSQTRRATEGICVKAVCPQLPQAPNAGVPGQAAGACSQQGVETSVFFYRVGDSMGWWDMELRRKLTNWPGNDLIDFDCIILYLIFKWASYVFICLYIISPCFAISLLRFRPFTPHSWGLQVHFNPFHCHADAATPYPESSIGYCTDCWTKLHLPCTDSYHLQDCHCQSWSSWIWDYALIVNWW